MSILGELQAFNQDQWVELYVLDATTLGAGLFYFHAGVNEFNADIIWQGTTYIALPVQASGFEYNGGGSFPRPKIKLANINGMFSVLIRSYNDLIGCKVTRKRTAVRYLDAANFVGGNASANPNEYLEDEVYYITQKTNENKYLIEFEMGSALDLQGVYLPRRQVLATVCPFRYRGEECAYTGTSYWTELDVVTTDPLLDKCSKSVTGCKLRFGENGELSFGGFPGAALVDYG